MKALITTITTALCLLATAAMAANPEIYGHRGARDLCPENTLPCYQKALEIGVDYVDMDIGVTKDGVVVVTHDLGLNPNLTRDKHWKWVKKPTNIYEFTYDELETYDVGRLKPDTHYGRVFKNQTPIDGTRIPTLRQVIHYVKSVAGDKVDFQIELKTDPSLPNATVTPKVFAQKVAKILEEENIVDRAEIQAFDWRCLIALQEINPKIKTAYLTYADGYKLMRSNDPKVAGLWSAGYLLKDYDNSIPKMIHALGGKIWDPQDVELSKRELEEAHKLGIEVNVWTWPSNTGKVFDKVLLNRLLDWGVDGIINDRPDLVRKLYKKRGLSVPPNYPIGHTLPPKK